MKQSGNQMEILNKLQSPFEKNKDEIWKELSKKIDDRYETKENPVFWTRYAFASVLFLLILSVSFMRFYKTTINCNRGEHIACTLPDNSTVELNAETTISYKPFWWKIKREVNLSGEAFFEVEKGKQFCVLSENGITQVVGTSFNIYARNRDYKVFCATGKVKVSSSQSNVEFFVKPGEMVVIDNVNKSGSLETTNLREIVFWKENKFNFESKPVKDVFVEFERQYNVKILSEIENIEDFEYTGFFEKSKEIDSTLNLVCKTFDFTFEEMENNKYRIFQK